MSVYNILVELLNFCTIF